jgi:ribosomal protein S18 acetylase RimI-like enzyme
MGSSERGFTAVRRLTTTAELYDASRGDVFVRAEWDARGGGHAWATDHAVAFLRGRGRRSLAALGEPRAAAALAAAAVEELEALSEPARAVTLPRGALDLLPPAIAVSDRDDWDWFWTDTAPDADSTPPAAWLDATSDEEIRAFLDASSPSCSAEPGSRWVRRWAGILDVDGALLATAAHCENVPGVPHLASIATRPDQRGRGLGRAVTAWVTRELLQDAAIVTLGMYADNEVARRLYRQLGYRDSHCFSSALLAGDRRERVPAPDDGCCGVVDCPHG